MTLLWHADLEVGISARYRCSHGTRRRWRPRRGPEGARPAPPARTATLAAMARAGPRRWVSSSAAAAGAMMSATRQQAAEARRCSHGADAEQHQQRGLPARREAPSEGAALAVEGAERERRCAPASAVPTVTASRPLAATRSPPEIPQVAEQQLPRAEAGGGRQREERAERRTMSETDDRDAEVGADPLVARPRARSRRRRRARPRRRRATSGAADQRGEHQAGQEPVAHPLGRAGLPVQEHPDAERAEGDAQDEHLQQRAAGDRVGEHQCSWCSTAIALLPSGSTTSSAP